MKEQETATERERVREDEGASEKAGECFFAIVQRASRTRKALLTTSKRLLEDRKSVV